MAEQGKTSASRRRSAVVHGRLAMRDAVLEAARNRAHGLQAMAFEPLAARLAGGLLRAIDDESLRAATQAALPGTQLGELDAIKSLPGFVGAAADTLRKAWRAGIDLEARSGEHPRLASLASLEKAVLAELPPASLRPPDLVAKALQRLEHAATLFGPIEVRGITELSPCWRPLLLAIARKTPVRWLAGPRPVPAWLDGSAVEIHTTERQCPAIQCASASTPYHEALEAMRWARRLLASGEAEPGEIAIAAASTAEYDDHFRALRSDASLDVHFAHGVRAASSREGQTAAAVADILLRGLSQTRIRRLSTLLAPLPGPFQALPRGWTGVLPADAPMSSPEAWEQLIGRLASADWPDGNDGGPALRKIVSLLAQGPGAAETIGESLLSGQALAIWRKALLAGPAASLDRTLEALKLEDRTDPFSSILWAPAAVLAASPRKYARLLGLNSSRWPRGIAEDRLLSEHILPRTELDPLPVSAADRRDFGTILATTERQVSLSRARRDGEGRLLGSSALLPAQPEETYLQRNRVPEHAFSESDRIASRPAEFRALPQARAAAAGWANWRKPELTPHDGLVRGGHPVVRAILEQPQSASSLRLLLRNPLGFLWFYGLGWRTPESGREPLWLEPLAMGDLVHQALEGALRGLEANGGLAAAGAEQIAAAVEDGIAGVAARWEQTRPVPPRILWQRALEEARSLGLRALSPGDGRRTGGTAFAEVPFGGMEPKSLAPLPWDAALAVEIPGTGIRIKGFIDRLEISPDGGTAHVCDYKTGRTPRQSIVLDGGRELQRCLYAFAVKAMLGDRVSIDATLLYLRDSAELRLEDPPGTLALISGYLLSARQNLLAGGCAAGIDAGDAYDDLAFALPANARAGYCSWKREAAAERLGAATAVWQAP